MTTSMSCAPASTDRRISAMRSVSGESPAGNPVETAATRTPLPSSARTAVSTKRVIHADRGNFNIQFFDAESLDQVMLNRLPRFGAQASNALLGVIAGERCEVHAGDGAQQPRRLPFLLYRPARGVTLRSAFDRAGVDANLLAPNRD